MNEEIKHIFENIYKKESDSIFRFCLMRVSDREQALDITGETFLRLWQNLLEDKKILNERAFLFTIARRLIIDWYRKKKSLSLDSMIQEDDESSFQVKDENTDSDNLLVESEGRYLIDKINDLDPIHKDPVYLRFVEDLSPPEIAKILGISINAASVRINRGLSELRKISGYNTENKYGK